MSDKQKDTLKQIHATLNQLEVAGKQNMLIVVTCMNEIEKLIKEVDDGNANT